jgi:hypothetical protein
LILDHYPFDIIVALDLFANASTGGHLGETMSSRIGRWMFGRRPGGWLAEVTVGNVGRLLDFLFHDHLIKAMEGSKQRADALSSEIAASLASLSRRPTTSE